MKTFWEAFEKKASKDSDDGLRPAHSITGALVGGVAGHRAARHLGAKTNSTGHLIARGLLSGMAAVKGSHIAGTADNLAHEQNKKFNKSFEKRFEKQKADQKKTASAFWAGFEKIAHFYTKPKGSTHYRMNVVATAGAPRPPKEALDAYKAYRASEPGSSEHTQFESQFKKKG